MPQNVLESKELRGKAGRINQDRGKTWENWEKLERERVFPLFWPVLDVSRPLFLLVLCLSVLVHLFVL